jgi:hypothetical protein
MASIPGLSFCAELNRLANDGDYPLMTAFKESQGAANAWAETTGKGLIAALNYKASSTRQPTEYKGLNDICNEIAGTSGLSAIAALRSIDL